MVAASSQCFGALCMCVLASPQASGPHGGRVFCVFVHACVRK
jgi:hypothetical protein